MKLIGGLVKLIIVYMFISLGNLYLYDISLFNKQLIWYLLGFGILCFYKKFSIKFVFILYLILNVLLLYLLLFGDSINGSRAWLSIGGFSIQPSEFMKVVLIVLLSYIVISNKKYLLKCFLLTLIPSVLTFLEPDTGNVIFYVLIFLCVIGGRVKLFKYFYIPLLLGVIFVYLYLFQIDLFISLFGSSFFYRLDRFKNLFDSYQLNMALIGISNSKLFGIDSLVMVPEVSTDFVFTLFIMNFGFIGLIFYISINLIFYYLLIRIYKNSVGITKEISYLFLIMKFVQEFIHIGMNVGILPITGITLPFISYGGSSLLSYFILLLFLISSYKDSSLDCRE